jgi:hypothetical protein
MAASQAPVILEALAPANSLSSQVIDEKQPRLAARCIDGDIASREDPDAELYPAPRAEDLTTLRKVAGTIPSITWLLCIVEFAERASYYGATTVFNNFLQKPLPTGMHPTNLEYPRPIPSS